jgi:hypothetical protein
LIAFSIKDDGINRQDKIFAASKLQIYLTLLRGKWVDFYRKESNTQGNRLYSINSKLKRKSSKYVFRYYSCGIR